MCYYSGTERYSTANCDNLLKCLCHWCLCTDVMRKNTDDGREIDLGRLFFQSLRLKFGGTSCLWVLNEQIVYVPQVCKSLSASKSYFLPPHTTMGGSCQCANMTRIRSQIMSSFAGVMTVVPGFLQCWHKTHKTVKYQRKEGVIRVRFVSSFLLLFLFINTSIF